MGAWKPGPLPGLACQPAAVHNLGGGRANGVSVLESFDRLRRLTGRPVEHDCDEANRLGDNICYISDIRGFKRDYPGWNVTRSLDDIFDEIVKAEMACAG